jgi:mannosyltransferase
MVNQFTASLWGDEAWAATLAVKPYLEIITTVARDTSPPLYYLCLHTWMKIFGTGEVSIRALSFFFFILTCLFVYLIGKKLWDQKTGLLAALACFLNPFLFQYAFEGRMYAILLLSSTAATYFYLSKNQKAYILAATAVLYSHHFSIFVIFTHFLWQIPHFFNKKEGLIKTLKPYLIIGLLYLPWLYPLYYQTSLVGSGFWLGKPNLKSLTDLFGTFFLDPAQGTARSFLIICLGGAFLLRRWGEIKKELTLISLYVIPIGLTYLISQFFSSIFYDRYLLYAIPPLLLLLVSRRRKISLLLIGLYFLIFIPLNYQYFTHPTKRPFRELADYVKSLGLENTTLINYNDQSHHLFESKYYQIPAPIYAPGGDLPFFTGTALMVEGDIIKELPDKPQIIAITSGEPEKVQLPDYEFKEEKSFGELHLVWLEKSKTAK